MKILVEVTQDIIKMTFSADSIKINGTTTTDLEWLMRNTISMLGLNFWFGPDVDMQRQGNLVSRIFDEPITYGDFLHCDIGVSCKFINLHTDMQWVCYVRKPEEDSAPKGLRDLLVKGNRLQDIVTSKFKYGKTGNDVFFESINQAKEEGIKPMIYSHPIGTFGHGSGTSIGRYDLQGFLEGCGECPIENETCYALELNVCDKLSEWDGQNVYMYLEEDIYFNSDVSYILGRQKEIIEI
ncbi:M24 family metallopeptidase [Clostridium sp.]|uniref:M24 family metallopeptidase n=1 Tax=Clostridium sp. TaxID=1506 RepID=UPI003217C87B